MTENENRPCPECTEPVPMDRRGFMRSIGGTATILAAGSMAAARKTSAARPVS